MSTNAETLPVVYSSLQSREVNPSSVATNPDQNSSTAMSASKKRGPIVGHMNVERSSSDENQSFPDLNDEFFEEKPKKFGRKTEENESLSKRKAQNRAAQRAFRRRKEDHLKTLETQVVSLQQLHSTTNVENDELRKRVKQLEDELAALRKGSFTFEMSLPQRDPSLFSVSNNINAPSVEPYKNSTFDTLPSTQSNSNSSSNPDSMSANGTQYGVPGLQFNGHKRSSTSLSLHQDDSSDHQIPSMDGKQFCQKLSSACGSIACSMLTKSTPHRASVDILTEENINNDPLDRFVNHANPEPLNLEILSSKPFSKSMYTDETIQSQEPKSVDQLAHNNLPDYDAIFEPSTNVLNNVNHESNSIADLFSTWREPTENLDKDYFNDEGDANDMFRTYFRDTEDENQGDEFSMFGIGQHTPATLDFFNENKLFADPSSLKKDGPYDIINVPPDYASVDLSNISNGPSFDRNKVQDKQPGVSPLPQNPQFNVEDEVVPNKEETYIKCPEVWSKIMSHPNFSQLDIDDLCAKLKQKAKCSASGVVVDKQELDQTLKKL
ncbi:transcription factor Pap1/Caf3, partial [Schizosaccharomyces cryophilus OY26]